MDINFIIHGKPLENDLFFSSSSDGLEEKINKDCFPRMEREFLKMKERERLEVEIVRWKEDVYSTYSLIKSETAGICDKAGRASYIILTLICKQNYSRQIGRIYNLLNQTFIQIQQATRVFDASEPTRFAIVNFNESEKELIRLESQISSIIEESFASDFKPIDSSFNFGNSNMSSRVSLNDVDSEAFFDILRRDGKVYVSTEYPSKNLQLEALQQQLERAADDKKQELEKLKMEKEALERKVAELQEEIKRKPTTVPRPQPQPTPHPQPKPAQRPAPQNAPKPADERTPKSKNEKKPPMDTLPAEMAGWFRGDDSSRKTGLLERAKAFLQQTRPADWLSLGSFILLIVCLLGVYRDYLPNHHSTERPVENATAANVEMDKQNVLTTEPEEEKIGCIKKLLIVQMFDNVSIDVASYKNPASLKGGVNYPLKLTYPKGSNTYLGINPVFGEWRVNDSIIGNDTLKFLEKVPETVVISYYYDGLKVLERKLK
ncbi:MAG: hypothetical protein IJ762_09485 [Bacteroidaceae bacterium]|nr:hypothetical protein [Bacteroidaceae bacterium]